jgi:hypothetical protein
MSVINSSSWSRSAYDQNVIEIDSKQSVSIGNRTLDPYSRVRCDQCLPQVPGGLQGTSYLGSQSLVDTESQMKNLGYQLSKDTQANYRVKLDNTQAFDPSASNGMTIFPDCKMRPEYTMMSSVCDPSREKTVNRFEPTCVNYQAENRWLFERIGIDASQQAKDLCVSCPLPQMDQSIFFPQGAPNVPCTFTPQRCLNWSTGK